MSQRIQRARMLMMRSRFDMAEKELGLALAESPSDAMAHAMMAMCLTEREKFDPAVEHAQQAVASDPELPFAHFVLGLVWKVRGYLDRAEKAIHEALRLDPAESRCYNLLAEIRIEQSRWAEAVEAAEQTLGIDPEDTTAINLRAFALRQMGRGEVSEAELHGALRLAPEDATTHANLGWNHLRSGNRDEAMRHFREALRLDPELDWARHGVVETLKAHNIFYRQMLKYFLWMQSLGRAGQWRVLLGAWIGYIIVRRVADAVPAAKPWLLPLIFGYLAFALSTILAVPLFNLALHLHPFGRLALSRDERHGSYWTGGFLLGLVFAGACYFFFPTDYVLSLAAFSGLMLIPVGVTSQISGPQPRRWMILYTVLVGVAGLGATMYFLVPDVDARKNLSLALAKALTGLCLIAFPLAALLSVWVGNILSSMRWKR